MDYGILYSRDATCSAPQLVGYVDASHADDRDTYRSTSGYILHFGGPVSWYSKLNPITTTSTPASEYTAMYFAVLQISHLRALLGEIAFVDDEPTVLYVDNSTAIGACQQLDGSSKKLRHIMIKTRFVQESESSGQTRSTKIDGKINHSDFLTKPNPGPIFEQHRRKACIVSLMEVFPDAPPLASIASADEPRETKEEMSDDESDTDDNKDSCGDEQDGF